MQRGKTGSGGQGQKEEKGRLSVAREVAWDGGWENDFCLPEGEWLGTEAGRTTFVSQRESQREDRPQNRWLLVSKYLLLSQFACQDGQHHGKDKEETS